MNLNLFGLAKHLSRMPYYRPSPPAPLEYKRLSEEQKGLCPICELPGTVKKPLVPDYAYPTDDIRGLVHVHCGQGLVRLRSNEVYLSNAIKYLRKHSQYS